jgi:hypothetical protein
MIEVVKYESSLYRDENTKKMTKFRDELEGYVAIPELSHLLVDGDREEGPYILDFGSKSDASNVDLTVLDAPSVRIVDFILSRVNDVIGKRLRHVFDEAGLHSLFDVSFYLNSFIINIGGTLCYVDTEGDPLSRRRQRRHARSRLEGNTDDFSSKGEVVNRLITQKRRDLFGGIPSAVLDNTSRLAYCFPDAYRSQGGFLHVIVEIQTGVRLYLSDDQYLDSAFDNLGMLAHYAKEGLDNDSEASTLASDVFSKYVFRITHALRSIRDTSSKEIREALIRSFDAASTYDPTHLRLSCSIGNLSEKSTVKNTPARNFRSVKKLERGECRTYVPRRTFIVSLHRPLASSMLEFVSRVTTDLRRLSDKKPKNLHLAAASLSRTCSRCTPRDHTHTNAGSLAGLLAEETHPHLHGVVQLRLRGGKTALRFVPG